MSSRPTSRVLPRRRELVAAPLIPAALSVTLAAAIPYDPLVRLRLGPLALLRHGITALVVLAGTAVMLPAARRCGLSDEFVYGIVTAP